MNKNVNIYSFYNNKGGVGKTTLSSNASSLYAKNHPETQVLVIDMCPQANVSQFLLGGGDKGYKTNQALQARATRRNIVGFIDWILKGNGNFTSLPNSFKIQVNPRNNRIPSNLYLIAGDNFLESFSLALNYAVINPANTRAWKEYMTAIRRLCELEFDKDNYKNMVVFIDCNPSFSIYTQMALLSSDYLIIPMMADYSSVEGIKGVFTMLYDQYPTEALKNYAENVLTFNKLVKNSDLKLPKIFEFVFNNFTTNLGPATAYAVLKRELDNFCYEQYKKFPELFADLDSPITNIDHWSHVFVSDVKDFHSAGKVSSSLGIPLTSLPGQVKYIMPDQTEVTLAYERYAEALENITDFVNKIH